MPVTEHGRDRVLALADAGQLPALPELDAEVQQPLLEGEVEPRPLDAGARLAVLLGKGGGEVGVAEEGAVGRGVAQGRDGFGFGCYGVS